MKPGHGDVLLAEGDVEVAEDEERLIEEFRRQLDEGMWAAVPTSDARRPPRGGDGARLLRDPARRRAGDLLPARRPEAEPSCRRPRGPAGRARRPGARSAFGPTCAAADAAAPPSAAPPRQPAYDPGASARRAQGARAAALRRRRGRLRDVPTSSASSACGGEAAAATATCSTPTGRSSPSTTRSGELLNEYCVRFPDRSPIPRPATRLPDADDVLAKWMALHGDERAPDRRRQHAPARAARSIPARCAATCAGCARGRAPATRRR